MKAIQFRIQNFRNIDDSDWIPLDKVTAFVGRNESGKTSLLKALHKFNPAVSEPYDPQREFPRDRYTRDYVSNGSEGKDWPVCSVKFELPDGLKSEIREQIQESANPPDSVTLTRFYDGSLQIEHDPPIDDLPLSPERVVAALRNFASRARRLAVPSEEEEYVGKIHPHQHGWNKARP